MFDKEILKNYVTDNEEGGNPKSQKYIDSENHPTIGIGFNLDKMGAKGRIEKLGLSYEDVYNGNASLTTEQIYSLFNPDIEDAIQIAKNTFTNFDQISPDRQIVLVDLAYNLGEGKIKAFKKMIAAVNQEDWNTAADELKESKYYTQVGIRGKKNVDTLRSDKITKPKKAKIDINGDDSTKPDHAANAKEKKDKKVEEVKSEIKSKAEPNAKVKSATTKCPLAKGKKPLTAKQIKSAAATKEKCNLGSLTVSKTKGTYVLNVKATPNACTAGEMEIVAGYNKRKAKIKCLVIGEVGPCKTHKSKTIDFTEHFTKKNDTNLEFDAASKYGFSYFPWQPATNSYSFSANTCGAIVGASIKVFPDTYWHLKVTTSFKEKKLDEIKIEGDFTEDQNNLKFSASSNGEISFDYSNDNSKTAFEMDDKGFKAGHQSGGTTVGLGASEKKVESYYQNTKTNTKSHTSLQIATAKAGNGEAQAAGVKDMSLQSGDIKFKIDEQLKKNINGLFRVVKIVQFIQGLIDAITKSGSPVVVNVKWPNIELEGNWQWKEIEGKPKCGFEYSIKGGLHPLIGSEIDIDLVGSVLLAVPGYGVFLNKILNSIEYITGDDLNVNLKLTGELNCDVDVSKKAGDLKATINSPKTHIDLILTLNATLKLKKHSFLLGYGGGAEGSAKIVIDVHKPIVEDHGIDLPCNYQFTGITVSSIEYKKESSIWSWALPDEEDQIVEEKNEIGTWLTGESHSFKIPLI